MLKEELQRRKLVWVFNYLLVMGKEAAQRCGAQSRLGALSPLGLRLIKLIVKVLCQCLSPGR